MFRKLKANEIECRAAMVKEKFCTLLLYKDARCDMNILDETVTPFNWKREHKRDNKNCVVSIYDGNKNEWISKEDTGTESFTEKEKGLASDSFKRACFNWGIGRELYTAPFVLINLNSGENYQKNTKYALSTKTRFKVSEIGYDDKGSISKLIIIDGKGNIRFTLLNKTKDDQEEILIKCIDAIEKIAIKKGIDSKLNEISKDVINSNYLKEEDIDKLKKLHNHLKNVEVKKEKEPDSISGLFNKK